MNVLLGFGGVSLFLTKQICQDSGAELVGQRRAACSLSQKENSRLQLDVREACRHAGYCAQNSGTIACFLCSL